MKFLSALFKKFPLHEKADAWNSLLIIFMGFVLMADMLLRSGVTASFDGPVHLTTIAQFYNALRSGDFPVYWADGFAHYGFPLGQVSQQVTPYLGSFFMLLVQNVELAYKLVYLTGVIVSAVVCYIFLRQFFSPLAALSGTVLFNFAPYRIINIYIRGAQPEVFGVTFILLVLLLLYKFLHTKQIRFLFLLTIATALLALTHPISLVVSSILFGIFVIVMLLFKKDTYLSMGKQLISIGFSMGLGLGIASYYILPLMREIQYFYYGSMDIFSDVHMLSIKHFIDPSWYYFTETEIYTRGHVMQSGLLETLIVLAGAITLVYTLVKKDVKKVQTWVLLFSVLSAFTLFFFMTPGSTILYEKIKTLGDIQHPWRMLTAFMCVPPIVLAYLINRFAPKNFVVAGVVILLIGFLRFPEVYGKNTTVYPNSHYFFTKLNLHSVNMNTIWTGQTEYYPERKINGEIISGKGKMLESERGNSWRKHVVQADTPVTISDNTFYFPGWKVLVDNAPVEIQFQDPNYRGIITYAVPAGKHTVDIKYTLTKTRLLGLLMSGFSLGLLIILMFFKKPLQRFVH